VSNSKAKWWLAAVVVCCLAPVSLADHGLHPDPGKKQPQVMPEGGSASIYLLGAGLTCLGAILWRSRIARS
jgi:hypothetical protein